MEFELEQPRSSVDESGHYRLRATDRPGEILLIALSYYYVTLFGKQITPIIPRFL